MNRMTGLLNRCTALEHDARRRFVLAVRNHNESGALGIHAPQQGRDEFRDDGFEIVHILVLSGFVLIEDFAHGGMDAIPSFAVGIEDNCLLEEQ